MGYPRGCLGVSGAGPKAGRRVRQPSGSRGHCPAGQCSRNSLGVSIFSVQRTGQLYGSRNKAASVCHPRGRQGVVNPARSPGLWQSQASQEPPTLFPKGEGRKFLPLGRQGVPEDGQRPPPAFGCHSLPSCGLLPREVPGPGSEVSPALTPLPADKHLLRAFCVPRLPGPQGAATKTLPTCKISTGWPRGRGRAGSEWLLWGQASEVTDTRPRTPCPSPPATGGGGGREGQGQFPFCARHSCLTQPLPQATGQPPSSPSIPLLRILKRNRSTSLPLESLGHAGAWDGDGAPAAPTLSHHMPALSHTGSSCLAPAPQAALLLPDSTRAAPTAWKAHSPSGPLTQLPAIIPPGNLPCPPEPLSPLRAVSGQCCLGPNGQQDCSAH